MKKSPFFLTLFLLFAIALFGQDKNTEKIKTLKFCGYKFRDTALLKKNYESQLDFLRINDGDTVIDVGTSSGSYPGVLSVITSAKNVHFILVDIDSNCLNPVKVNNMISYYQGLHGTPFNSTFSIVVNTTDSLYLPLNRYKKILILNTLHETGDKAKMAMEIAAVLQHGGEVIVGEMLATEKVTIHAGCNKPLMSVDEIVNLFSRFGFRLSGKENVLPELLDTISRGA